jgi:hypothetical protein
VAWLRGGQRRFVVGPRRLELGLSLSVVRASRADGEVMFGVGNTPQRGRLQSGGVDAPSVRLIRRSSKAPRPKGGYGFPGHSHGFFGSAGAEHDDLPLSLDTR